MKNILIIWLLFSIFSLRSQNTYFGYPSDLNNVQKGDTLIVNMPFYNDGRFETSKNLDSLFTLLNLKKDIKVKIEINIFFSFSLSAQSLTYSNTLLRSLDDHLKLKKINNYELISNGNSKPLYPKIKGKTYNRNERLLYNRRNTYLKLIIK